MSWRIGQTGGPLAAAGALALLVGAVVALAAFSPTRSKPAAAVRSSSSDAASIEAPVAALDSVFRKRWAEHRLQPARPADELLVLRRLTLALHGRTPSLAEIRHFESDRRDDRLFHWTESLLADRRFADYLAARLSHALISNTNDDFPEYRPDHYAGWLSDALHEGRPFDAIVRETIAASGFPIQRPQLNFVTSEMVLQEDYASRLAARATRVYLGQRIDCAQCHDHPFAAWKQTDFQGLAAFFAPLEIRRGIVADAPGKLLEIPDQPSGRVQVVSPAVPFRADLLPSDGDPRQRLAAWITHPENRRFPRAIANRLWGFMFGRPLATPVDDIPDPSSSSEPSAVGVDAQTELAALDMLAEELVESRYDLKRVLRIIGASSVFRLDSRHPDLSHPGKCELVQRLWATFPMTPLRGEQIQRSLEQVRSLTPIDLRASLFVQARQVHETERFQREFGQNGQDELELRPVTIPQTLLAMNGRFVDRASRARLNSASGRIALLAPSKQRLLESCYLACLARRPTSQEIEQLASSSPNPTGRLRLAEDIYWALLNSPEFSWNH